MTWACNCKTLTQIVIARAPVFEAAAYCSGRNTCRYHVFGASGGLIVYSMSQDPIITKAFTSGLLGSSWVSRLWAALEKAVWRSCGSARLPRNWPHLISVLDDHVQRLYRLCLHSQGNADSPEDSPWTQNPDDRLRPEFRKQRKPHSLVHHQSTNKCSVKPEAAVSLEAEFFGGPFDGSPFGVRL